MKRTAKIRYAIVGLGHLAQVAILPAFRQARWSELAVLVSGDSAKGRVLSKKYLVCQRITTTTLKSLWRRRTSTLFLSLCQTRSTANTRNARHRQESMSCVKNPWQRRSGLLANDPGLRRRGVILMIAYRLHFADSHLPGHWAGEERRARRTALLQFAFRHAGKRR